MPAPATGDRVESGRYRVREGTSSSFGNPSNEATLSWRQAGTGEGGYTPFPFVITRMPTISHSGCTSRPPYVASNPQNGSFIDPMSGLEVFRVSPSRGASVLINNATDTGLNFPANLKGDNNPHVQRVWNADGTLLMFGDSKSRSSDPSSPCRSALIDVDGNQGNSGPWRFLRAAGSAGLGDPGVTINSWFWDPLNPLRAYVCKVDGMYEWFPAGAPGESVGRQRFLFGWPGGGGLTHFHLAESHHAKIAYDGTIYHAPCRRTSDGKRGSIRINLLTGAANSFQPHPLAYVDDAALAAIGTGPLGVNSCFAHTTQFEPKSHRFVNMVTGALSVNYDGAKAIGGHPDTFPRDGEEFLFGTNANPTHWSGLRFSDGALIHFADDSNLGVEHVSCRAFKDTWQLHPMPGGPSTGLRYALVCVSNPSARKGIMGLRLGHGDMNQWRYICHHRTNRTDNGNECHPQPSPDFRKVLFPSNWCAPGVETDTSHVNNYVVLIPDAWYSPNNDGS
jgi:hypothetical protein